MFSYIRWMVFGWGASGRKGEREREGKRYRRNVKKGREIRVMNTGARGAKVKRGAKDEVEVEVEVVRSEEGHRGLRESCKRRFREQ